jgi:hypothetical protein
MKRYILIGLLFWQYAVYAQKQDEAIVLEDNLIVFKDASNKSDTVYTLQKNEIFLLAENDGNDQNWIAIEISQNKFSKHIANQDVFITGFIPRSKIHLIDSLPKCEPSEIGLKFNIVKADTTIADNQVNLGYGLEIPLSMSFVVNDMFIEWKGSLLKQDHNLFDDLFNVAFKEGMYSTGHIKWVSSYKFGDCFYIKQGCGDGAVSYEITWVIKDGIILQRMIDEI